MEHPEHLLHPSLAEHFRSQHESPTVRARLARHSIWLPMLAIAPVMLISALDMTTLNVALPDMAAKLGATTGQLQWIVDAYTIVLAGLLLFAQGLADRFGRKGVFMTGMAIFGCASASAAFMPQPAGVMAARALMGLGAAMMMSPTLAIMAVVYPPEQRGKAVAIWVAVGSIGTAIGPIVGGVLVDLFDWRATFLVNVPVIAFALVVSAMFLPTSRRPAGDGVQKLDLVGAALSIVGLGVLLYGVIEGPKAGWLSAQSVLAIGLGLAVTAGFIAWEMRSPDPMFHPRVFRRLGVQAGAGALFVDYVAFLGMLFLMPQYLQLVLGHSAAMTGVILVPFGVAVGLVAQVATKLSLRLGRERLVSTGMGCLMVGFLVLCFIGADHGTAIVLLGTLVLGVGFGLTIGPATTMVVDSLPVAEAGDGSSVNMVMRQTGGAFGTALIGSVFSTIFLASVAGAVRASGISASSEHSIEDISAAARSLSPAARAALLQSADHAFVAGARGGLLVGAAVALIAAIWAGAVAARTRRDERRSDTAPLEGASA